jgi:hypothetical protein
MQNIFIVHLINRDTNTAYKLVGVYSSKERADSAGKEACELYTNSQYTVTIKALDDIIDGLNN